MCYELFLGRNKETDTEEFEAICKKFDKFCPDCKNENLGFEIDKKTIFSSISCRGCACDTKIGRGDSSLQEIQDYAQWITELRNCEGIQRLYILKHWINSKVEYKEVVHIEDLDLPSFLANVEDETIYKIHLYKKYY